MANIKYINIFFIINIFNSSNNMENKWKLEKI